MTTRQVMTAFFISGPTVTHTTCPTATAPADSRNLAGVIAELYSKYSHIPKDSALAVDLARRVWQTLPMEHQSQLRQLAAFTEAGEVIGHRATDDLVVYRLADRETFNTEYGYKVTPFGSAVLSAGEL